MSDEFYGGDVPDEFTSPELDKVMEKAQSKGGKVIAIRPELVEIYRQTVIDAFAQCTTKRESLDVQIKSLTECVGIATEIYKNYPVPDNAYQLAALTNALNSSVSLFEKLGDPQKTLSECENEIQGMFNNTLKALVTEIDKAKKEFSRLYPNDKTHIEDIFRRMIQSVSPDAKRIYDEMHVNLKKILGIIK